MIYAISSSSRPVRPAAARTRHPRRRAAFGLLLVPALLGAGTVVDSVRDTQFRAQLANMANEAAIEGAMVYIDRGAAADAKAVAARYFHAQPGRWSDGSQAPHVDVRATPAAAYGQKGYGVTVEITATPSHLQPDFLAAAEPISITAFAINPIDPANYAKGHFRIEAKGTEQARLAVLSGG